MDYVSEATFPQGAAIGTKRRFSITSARTYCLAFASDEEASRDLIGRMLGPFASSRGSFTFECDHTHQWFHKTDATGKGAAQGAVGTILDTPRHLGSISLKGAVLSFQADILSSFTLECVEGEKTRSISGTLRDGRYFPMPPDWEFDPTTLAREIYSIF